MHPRNAPPIYKLTWRPGLSVGSWGCRRTLRALVSQSATPIEFRNQRSCKRRSNLRDRIRKY